MSEERIIKVDYEDEMKKSYIDYAMSVIVQRALPDVRDGLKPVHRRILYAMQELHLYSDRSYRKSARIVGDTMGKYHPHGDSSIYDAMVRMTQDYSLLIPLVDGHGNFGSIDGDNPAAMRYTEARLAPLASEMLKDMEKNVIEYTDNFDESLKEPTVLPSKFPNLLVNGASGIAVGMKTDIPPHNLNEVVNACKAFMDNEDITSKQLRKYVKGPDFPTGGIITNKNDLKNIYETGNGKIKIRSKIEIEDAGYGKTNLVITEIPYSFSGNKTRLIESIINLIKDRKLDELSDVWDESNKKGIRIVLEAKRGVNIDNLLSKLYKKTKLEDSIGTNFLAIVNGEPKMLNLKEIIRHFIEFQKDINIRKYTYLLNKSNERKEVLEGLIKAHDIIDLIIHILRGSRDIKTAKACLINGETTEVNFKTKKAEKQASKLNFSEKQATAILEMRLQKLIGLELEKLDEEYKDLLDKIDVYNKILTEKKELYKVIKVDLDGIKKKYGKRRKTLIKDVVEEYEDEFITEDLHILIDRFGYIKTIDIPSYNRCNAETLSKYKTIIKASSMDKLCMFTQEGYLHQIKVFDIPKSKIKDKGVLIDTLCDVGQEEIILLTTFKEIIKKRLLFITKQGYIKIVQSAEFDSIRRNINSIKLTENDKLLDIIPLKEDSNIKYIILQSEKNNLLKLEIDEIPEQKRISKGIITLKLEKDDKIIKVHKLKKNENKSIKINKKQINLHDLN